MLMAEGIMETGKHNGRYQTMKKTMRCMSLLMAVALLIGLMAGCGDKKEQTDPNAIVYQANYTDIQVDDINYLDNVAFGDDAAYFTADVVTGTVQHTADEIAEEDAVADTYDSAATWEETVTEIRLFKLNYETGEATPLPDYQEDQLPDGVNGGSGITALHAAADGTLWLLQDMYIYNQMDMENSSDGVYAADNNDQYTLIHVSDTGKELARFPLNEVLSSNPDDYISINNFLIGEDGSMYLMNNWTALYVLDSEGKLKFKIEEDGMEDLLQMGDGTVVLTRWGENGMEICKVDAAAQKLEDGEPLSTTSYSKLCGGGDEKYSLYYDTGNAVFGYDAAKKTSDKLFDWLASDVDSDNVRATKIMNDGTVIAFMSSWDDNYESQQLSLVKLVPKKASEVAQKSELTLATLWMDSSLRNMVLEFNRNDPDYRIVVHDYSEYNTNDDYSAGQTKLATEIVAGNVPDILYANNLPIDQYAAKGLLEDLWPMIDNDTELGGRDVLMSQVFQAMEQDGKLYEITPSFSIDTAVGLTSVVGDRLSWTLDDMQEALKKLPEGATIFNNTITKSDVLQTYCNRNADSFVDWATGQCSFDSPEFVKILEFANSFQQSFDWENMDWENDYISDDQGVREGKQLVASAYVSDLEYYLMQISQYGGDVTFVGYPTESGNGSVFNIDSSISISSKCKDKEAAWRFVRQYLTKDYQENNVWSLPTNKTVFDEKIKDIMTPQYYTDENGVQQEEPITSWWVDDQEVAIYSMSQAQYDQLMELINSITQISRYDDDILNIINEEAEAYFSGQSTAQDTANMIQSRVKIYVNEQM